MANGRVYFDRHGRTIGYSAPIWLVVVFWLMFAALVCAPILALAGWLGAGQSPIVAVACILWLVIVWGVFHKR